jgi:hypothetical protein
MHFSKKEGQFRCHKTEMPVEIATGFFVLLKALTFRLVVILRNKNYPVPGFARPLHPTEKA